MLFRPCVQLQLNFFLLFRPTDQARFIGDASKLIVFGINKLYAFDLLVWFGPKTYVAWLEF